jgi:hypothetical protein
LVFAPEERRNVATGETRGKNRTGKLAPAGAKDSLAPTGATEKTGAASTGFTRGYIPALLRSEMAAKLSDFAYFVFDTSPVITYPTIEIAVAIDPDCVFCFTV